MAQQKKICFLVLSFMGSVFLQADVYKSHLSDVWYASRGKNLQRQLQEMQEKATNRFDQKFDAQKIKAIIVPHAGYNYSGVLASGVYKNLKLKTFDRVIILAPSHHSNFDGIALPGLEYFWYKNPLGYLQLDKNMLKKLQKSSTLFFCDQYAHELEHAVEVQIPLIQKYVGSSKIVPLLIGDLNFDQIQKVAEILGSMIDKKTLVIVSSDFTHYGKIFGYRPFDHDILKNIFKLDEHLIAAIRAQNPQAFADEIRKTRNPVCGKNSILILLSMIQKKYFGNVSCHVIGYDNSAPDQTDSENCVSYVGMVVTQVKT